jgi:PAS domain S-box-containing protein
LFQNGYDAAFVTDWSGKIMEANLRAVDFFGYRPEEFCRMFITDLISGSDESLPRTIRENLEHERFMLIQAHCARKGGALFPAEISVNKVNLSKRPYLCFMIRDVTVRRQTEELLRTVHNAIQNSADGIAVADMQAKLRYVNPAVLKLWGSEASRIIGRSVRDLWAEKGPADRMVRMVLNGRTWNGELLAECEGGRRTHVQVVACPNRDADGEMQGMVMSLVDVTDRKQAEEALRQTERQQVMLESIGAACHHLGQPATVLLASLSLLQKRDGQPDSEHQRLLETSIHAAESISEILHELNAIREYRTVPYLGRSPETRVASDSILKI